MEKLEEFINDSFITFFISVIYVCLYTYSFIYTINSHLLGAFLILNGAWFLLVLLYFFKIPLIEHQHRLIFISRFIFLVFLVFNIIILLILLNKYSVLLKMQIIFTIINISLLCAIFFTHIFTGWFTEFIVPAVRPEDLSFIQDFLFGDYLEEPRYEPIEKSTCMKDLLENIVIPKGRPRLTSVEADRVDQKFKENLVEALKEHLPRILYPALKGKIFCFFLTCFTILTPVSIYLENLKS